MGITQNFHPLRHHSKNDIRYCHFVPLQHPKHTSPSAVWIPVATAVFVRWEKIFGAAQTELSFI